MSSASTKVTNEYLFKIYVIHIIFNVCVFNLTEKKKKETTKVQ